MNTRTLAVLGLFLNLLLAGLLRAAPEPPPSKATAELAKARLEAAQKTFAEVWRTHHEGRYSRTESVYQWSLRWLAAERDLSPAKADQVAAFKAHWNRMRDLDRMTREKYRSRLVPGEEATAAEFYRLEAELWWTKAQAE
jgi:hypothetical protein